MKTGLMLRQEVPKDKERIMFDSIYEVDDMWIWLFFMLHKKFEFNHSEIWMWNGGPRSVRYLDDFIEWWWREFPIDNLNFDFIFSRGGFKEYMPVMQACSKAFKLYYGAIFKARFNPKANGDLTDYNLVLADSRKQFLELKDSGYEVHKFLKPACGNIFYPISKEKIYDVVFIANAKQKKIKGHKWFLEIMDGSGLKILQIGNTDPEIIELAKNLDLNITFNGWVPRKDIPELACMARVGVCCSEGDSCPRVIPEMLCMDIPVVVRDNDGLYIWDDYFYDDSCVRIDGSDFVHALKYVLDKEREFKPRKFYQKYFSLQKVVDNLASKIKGIADW